MVLFPNINVVDEMVDLVDASRTYEANLAALRTWRQMLRQTLDMAR
jgi:flagellar basal-body rod protein FlgC